MTQRESGILLCLVGPTGSGKTSLARRLKSEFDGTLDVAVSVTTREKRPFEVEASSYFFVSKEDFKKMQSRSELFESEEVHGYWYGQKKAILDAVFTKKIDVVLDIDIKGAFSVKKGYPDNTIIVFLLPPSLEVLRERLINRSPVSEDELQKRLATASIEFQALQKSHKQKLSVDYILENETLEFCFQELRQILLTERKRYARLSLEYVKTQCFLGMVQS